MAEIKLIIVDPQQINYKIGETNLATCYLTDNGLLDKDSSVSCFDFVICS